MVGAVGDEAQAVMARRSELRIFDLLNQARDAIGVRRVFGDPIEVDGTTLVPAAWVAGGMGGGGGVVGPDDRHDASHGGGMGLFSMRERAALLGGSCTVVAAPSGRGTLVRAALGA